MGFLKILISVVLLQSATPQPAQTGSIEGRIISTSGANLSKVMVTLSGPISSPALPASPTGRPVQPAESTTATTDADGKFAFDNLKAGPYRLRAARQGFDATEYGQKGPNGVGIPISVASGQKVKDIAVTLTQQGIITGRVVDPYGMPFSRAMVQLWKNTYRGAGGGRALSMVESVTTDDLGNYRLFWVSPGSYLVSASPRVSYGLVVVSNAGTTVSVSTAVGNTNSNIQVSGQTRSDGTPAEEALVSTYFPATPNARDATPIIVHSGMTVEGVNISFLSVPVFRIRGVTINGTTGSPGPMSILLSRTGAETGSVDTRNSSDSGAFELAGVVPGSYSLIGAKAVIPINVVNSDISGIILNGVSAEPFAINGRILSDGGLSDAGFPNAGVRVRLSPSSSLTYSPVDVAGNFTIRGVVPGDYQVVLEGDPRQYVKSVRFANQDGMDGIHIQSPSDGQLDIILSSKKGSVDGRILNERREPVVNATVVLVPDPPFRQRTGMYIRPTVDMSGKFHIDAVPGLYRIFAWEDVENGAWLDPDFMSANESRGRSIVVTEESKESLEVLVIPYIP